MHLRKLFRFQGKPFPVCTNTPEKRTEHPAKGPLVRNDTVNSLKASKWFFEPGNLTTKT